MSRSYRKPCDGYIIHSVTVSGFNRGIHNDKKENNRRLRRKANLKIKEYSEDSNIILPIKLDEVMERWSYRDDGKTRSSLKYILEECDRPWEFLSK